MLIKIFKKSMKYVQLLEIPFLCFFVLFCLLESSDSFATTPNAFVFSLNNFKELAPFVSRVKKGHIEEAIYGSSATGPTFGQDLFILSAGSGRQSFADLGAYYSLPASVTGKLAILDRSKDSFSTDEVEVFYLHPSR